MRRFEFFFLVIIALGIFGQRVFLQDHEFPAHGGMDVDVITSLLHDRMVMQNYTDDSLDVPQVVFSEDSGLLPPGVSLSLQNTLRIDGMVGYLFFLNVGDVADRARPRTMEPIDYTSLYDEWESLDMRPPLTSDEMAAPIPPSKNDAAQSDSYVRIDLAPLFHDKPAAVRHIIDVWPPSIDQKPGRIDHIGHHTWLAQSDHIYPIVVVVGDNRTWFDHRYPDEISYPLVR